MCSWTSSKVILYVFQCLKDSDNEETIFDKKNLCHLIYYCENCWPNSVFFFCCITVLQFIVKRDFLGFLGNAAFEWNWKFRKCLENAGISDEFHRWMHKIIILSPPSDRFQINFRIFFENGLSKTNLPSHLLLSKLNFGRYSLQTLHKIL